MIIRTIISTQTLCDRVFTIEHRRSDRSVTLVYRIDGKRRPYESWHTQLEIERGFDSIHRLLKGEAA